MTEVTTIIRAHPARLPRRMTHPLLRARNPIGLRPRRATVGHLAVVSDRQAGAASTVRSTA